MKILKKYSILSRLWALFNTILLTIFGISLVDIYEIELLSNLFNNILDIFSKFHNNILELFSKKVEVPIESPSSMKTINKSSTGNQESNKIIERFNKIINKDDEIEENNPIYKNKYAIIAGILILSGLTWYFYDDVIPSPQAYEDVTLATIQERLNTSPLLHKTSISNMFEDTMNLFEGEPEDAGIDTSGESSNNEVTQSTVETPQVQSKSGFSALFDSIKSRRLEYGSPSNTGGALPQVNEEIPTVENESDSSSDNELNPWNDIKVNIKKGDVYNKYVDIDFGDLRDKVRKVMIMTNDGETNYLNPNLEHKNTLQTFKWDNKGISNHYYKDLEIKFIYIIEHNVPKPHQIYYNPEVKSLPPYIETILK